MNTATVFEKIIIPLVAAFIGAIAAFWFQNRSQKKSVKFQVLANLMGSRHMGPGDDDFVKYINMVCVVFHDSKNVKEKLDRYFEYTGSKHYSGGQRVAAIYDLLLAMSQDLGYQITHADVKEYFVPLRTNGPQSNEDSGS